MNVPILLITSTRLRWERHVARIGERRCASRVLVEKPEGRRPLGRPRRRWEDNIKMGHGEVGWGGTMDRTGSRKIKVAGSCECGNEPSGFIKFGEFH
jgi:hypothetical protein